MTIQTLLVSVRTALFGSAWDPLARWAWCRRQRRHLGVPGHAVVWIRGGALPWAEWGQRHGFFLVDRMDGIPYLRPLSAPLG